jgi:hypothetical protein
MRALFILIMNFIVEMSSGRGCVCRKYKPGHSGDEALVAAVDKNGLPRL